jgi:hypothetical protein
VLGSLFATEWLLIQIAHDGRIAEEGVEGIEVRHRVLTKDETLTAQGQAHAPIVGSALG